MPERIQLRRTRGWRKPPGTIVVTRSTMWGNPFTPEGAIFAGYEQPSRACVNHFTAWVEGNPDYPDVYKLGGRDFNRIQIRDNLRDLTGRDLACWCPLTDDDGERFPCHADVLLRLANPPQPTAEAPWRVELCWTTDQNFGAVSVAATRTPVYAIWGLLAAGEHLKTVAAECGCTEAEVWVLEQLRRETWGPPRSDDHEESR